MTTNQLSNIAFEDITDDYCYGNYGEFKVIMMKKNGYINATKMCQDISEQIKVSKPYKIWLQNKTANELVNCISSMVGIPTTELVIVIKGGCNQQLWGTYVHPDLIPHIASWGSPKFAVKVSRIVNKYINKKELRKKEHTIAKQSDKIDELMKKLDIQAEEATKRAEETKQRDEIQSAKIDKLLDKNKKISKKLTVIKEQNQDLSQQNDELLDKVTTIAEDRVVKTETSDDSHMFVVMKDETSDPKERYYAIRVKRKIIKPTIKRYKNTHPDAIILLEIKYNPNSINLYDRIKSNLKDKLRFKLNNFGLKKNYSEKEMIEDINNINEEKMEV